MTQEYCNALFSQKIPEVHYCVLSILHEMGLCIVADILREGREKLQWKYSATSAKHTVSSPRKDTAHAI
jgi:hypothetical protein